MRTRTQSSSTSTTLQRFSRLQCSNGLLGEDYCRQLCWTSGSAATAVGTAAASKLEVLRSLLATQLYIGVDGPAAARVWCMQQCQCCPSLCASVGLQVAAGVTDRRHEMLSPMSRSCISSSSLGAGLPVAPPLCESQCDLLTWWQIISARDAAARHSHVQLHEFMLPCHCHCPNSLVWHLLLQVL